MTQVSQIPAVLNQLAADIDLKDALDQLRKNIFQSLNCHAIATIQNFNPANQTVQATVNYTQTRYVLQAGQYVATQVNYPLVVDCPVVVMGGGSGYVSFPIASGDQALIIFNDRDMDNWWAGSQNGPVNSNRMHSFADCIAIVGLHSMLNPIQSYDAIRALLKAGSAVVGCNPQNSKVLIANSTPSDGAYATTLNTVLQDILTQLQNLTSQLAALTVTGVTSGSNPSGVPTNAVAITAIGAQLNTLATDLGDILE